MRLLLCYLCPPVAVLLCGKPFTAVLNFGFTCFFWLPGVSHALFVVNNHLDDKRTNRVVKAINHPEWTKAPAVTRTPRARKAEPRVRDNVDSYTTGRNGTKFRLRQR